MAPKRPLAYSYIRISSDPQLRGDSLRRQLEASNRYAAEHDLDLVEDMRDLGVSGFTGANIGPEGALGRFLVAVRSNRVPRGSFILVENLDRLSREDPHRALGPFLEIINSGIGIVTLQDGKVYTAENLQVPDLIMSILIMGRANEESRTKSLRIGEAWEKKRKNRGERAADQALSSVAADEEGSARLRGDRVEGGGRPAHL
jgi:DNA invertase Pin-like site-specific DNA recombinase